MTRRELIKLAAFAALTPIAVRLEPVRAAFLQNPKLSTFMVSFPDGTEWSFRGFLESLASSSMTIVPTGSMRLDRREATPDNRATILTLDDIAIGEIDEVVPPTVSQSQIDVTSNHRPDPTWRFVDAQNHEHRWYVSNQPAERYRPTDSYEMPTLVWVHDGTCCYEDGSEYEIGHHACKLCGEAIEPRYCANSYEQYIPGVRRVGSIVIHGKFA